MIIIEQYTESIFEVVDKEGYITKVKRRYDKTNNKLDWFFRFYGDATWENCDKKDRYNNIQGYDHLSSDFYSSESLEMLYRTEKIDKILE